MTFLVAKLKNEIEFDSIDGQPVKVVFMISVPDHIGNNYMELLSSVARFWCDPDDRELIYNAKSSEEIYNIFKNFDEEKL